MVGTFVKPVEHTARRVNPRVSCGLQVTERRCGLSGHSKHAALVREGDRAGAGAGQGLQEEPLYRLLDFAVH